MPVEAVRLAPFMVLSDFLAHEEQLLSRMRVLVAIEQTEIRKLLPQVAGHFVEQRVLAMNDFVVREGQNEVLAEGVEQRKRNFVVHVFAVDGIVREIVERVVHPSHVPFEAETQPAEIGRTGYGGPGSGFFSDGEDTEKFAVRDLVHALEKFDGVKIFAAAELIGNPLAELARIIEIKHGSNGVHAEAVDMVLVEPEQGTRDQIILHFVAAIVVNERAPIGMRALARVGVLVEMAAVKLREAVRVARKMRGRPVENHAEASLVAPVDKFHEIHGRTVAAGGGKVAERLIPP